MIFVLFLCCCTPGMVYAKKNHPRCTAYDGPSASGPLVRGTYCFVADIDAGAEPGEVDIYPPGIGRYGIEIGAVLHYVGIDGIFEGIGIAGSVECLVFVRWEVDLEIAAPFGGVDGVAGTDKGQKRKESDEAGDRHDVDFDV